jgi:excisionase family DNA binding protein
VTPLILALDRGVAGHVFLAMREWPAVARRNNMPLPDGWDVLQAAFERAARVQTSLDGATVVAPFPTVEPVVVERLLYTVEQLVEQTGWSEATIRRAIREGRLRVIREGRAIRVHRDDVAEWLDSLRDVPRRITTKEVA